MARGKGRSNRSRGRSRRRGGGGGRSFGRRSPRSLLRGALDATLEGVVVNLAVHNGDLQEDPVSLLLKFDNGTELGVCTGSDGESIRVGRKLQSPYLEDDPEMGVAEEEQTESEQWMAFVGKRCEDVLEVRDMSFGGKGNWAGLELCFEGGAILSLFNWDDELLCDPPDVVGDFLERHSVRRREEQEGAGHESGAAPATEGDSGDEVVEQAPASKRNGGSDRGEDPSDDDEPSDDGDSEEANGEDDLPENEEE